MRRSCIPLLLLTVFATSCGGTQTAHKLAVLDNPEQLREEFIRKAGHARLVLFLSPT